MKICLVSSSGGHWEELMCLTELSNRYESFYITEEGSQAKEAKVKHIYTVPQINRHEKFFLFHFIRLFFYFTKLLVREKPDVVISTGALVSFPVCLIQKLRRGKVVYIESFARVYDGSLTGKLVYPFADLFIIQWKELISIYPKAHYIGGIF